MPDTSKVTRTSPAPPRSHESWRDFYARTEGFPHRDLTEQAVALAAGQPAKIAVDAGCGSGLDIPYLRSQGYTVYSYDAEAAAIEYCRERYGDDPGVHLQCASFVDYRHPRASLVLAHRSLFFCPPSQFAAAWEAITECLPAGGVLSVDILGVNDSWAREPALNVSAFTQREVEQLLVPFDIQSWQITDEPGTTLQGLAKHWHFFTAVACKR